MLERVQSGRTRCAWTEEVCALQIQNAAEAAPQAGQSQRARASETASLQSVLPEGWRHGVEVTERGPVSILQPSAVKVRRDEKEGQGAGLARTNAGWKASAAATRGRK